MCKMNWWVGAFTAIHLVELLLFHLLFLFFLFHNVKNVIFVINLVACTLFFHPSSPPS